MTRRALGFSTASGALLLAACAHGPVYQALKHAGGTTRLNPLVSSEAGDRADACDEARAQQQKDSAACLATLPALRERGLWSLANQMTIEQCAAGDGLECYWEGVVLFEGRPGVPGDRAKGAQILREFCAHEPVHCQSASCSRNREIRFGVAQVAACMRLAVAAAKHELPSADSEVESLARRSCELDTALEKDTGLREPLLGVKARSQGGACQTARDRYQAGDGLPKDDALSEEYRARADELAAKAAFYDIQREWRRKIKSCVSFEHRTAMSCAAEECPHECSTPACVEACLRDAPSSSEWDFDGTAIF